MRFWTIQKPWPSGRNDSKEFFMIVSSALIWFFAGVVFLIAEMLLPAFILIFFTLGCWIAGIAVWLFEPDLTGQIVVFILSSFALLVTLRRYGLRTFKGRIIKGVDGSTPDAKIGKTALVTGAIRLGREGEIKMQGSFWRAVADKEISEGRSVVVVEKISEDGLTFKVKEIERT
jgi:membrane protein implicated in regulation of membrane protease activity